MSRNIGDKMFKTVFCVGGVFAAGTFGLMTYGVFGIGADSSSRKDYLEGVVVDKSVYGYALRARTEKGDYSMQVESSSGRPASALLIAIDKGDKIKFSSRHFEEDRIGYCETSEISIVEKVKNPGQVESLENK